MIIHRKSPPDNQINGLLDFINRFARNVDPCIRAEGEIDFTQSSNAEALLASFSEENVEMIQQLNDTVSTTQPTQNNERRTKYKKNLGCGGS
jgi:hypothetical protein